MASDYLNRLTITPEERSRLADLGAAGPLAILGIRRAAPEIFNGLFGQDRAAVIVEQLMALLNEEERAILAAPPVPLRPLGARL